MRDRTATAGAEVARAEVVEPWATESMGTFAPTASATGALESAREPSEQVVSATSATGGGATPGNDDLRDAPETLTSTVAAEVAAKAESATATRTATRAVSATATVAVVLRIRTPSSTPTVAPKVDVDADADVERDSDLDAAGAATVGATRGSRALSATSFVADAATSAAAKDASVADETLTVEALESATTLAAAQSAVATETGLATIVSTATGGASLATAPMGSIATSTEAVAATDTATRYPTPTNTRVRVRATSTRRSRLRTATRVPAFTATPIPPTATLTATATDTPTPTATFTPTATDTPTPIPTATFTPTATDTPTPTPTATYTPTATDTPTPVPTPTPLPPTVTPLPTDTPTPEVNWRPEPNATQVARSGEFVDNDDCADLRFQSRLPDRIVTIRVGDVGLRVVAEIANSGAERTQGLMCRRRMSDGTGMLFVFSGEAQRNFWMFNTYISLDIVYLDGDREPVSARTMSPCPRPSGADDSEWSSRCTEASRGYGSGDDARYALELPAGWLSSETGLSLRNIVREAVFDW